MAGKNRDYKWTMWMVQRYTENLVDVDGTNIKRPLISDVIVLNDERLLMADTANEELMVVSLSVSGRCSIISRHFDAQPRYLALLSDGKVASMMSDKSIVFLNVQVSLLIHSTIRTEKVYKYGMVAGPDDMLIVCGKEYNKPRAFVDIIRRDGQLVKTIVACDSTQLTLKMPGFMCVMGNHLLVPDSTADCVYKVEICTGHLVETISHDSIYGPTQVICDNSGSLFIHFMKFDRWLEYTPPKDWKPYILKKNQDRLPWIRKICPTESGFVVLFVQKARPFSFSQSMVMKYKLSA